jgi:DNA (cytosine-5)-methyltransferase 1
LGERYVRRALPYVRYALLIIYAVSLLKVKEKPEFNLKVISLFAGAGGLDLGFIRAGHKVVWANDHDIDAVNTYKENIGNHIVSGDIEAIDPAGIPKADILIGGFPCQGFSCANLRRSPEDKRNSLYLQFLKVLKQKNPKYFLAENVRGLLSLDEGRVIKMIEGDFENGGPDSDHGYDVKHLVLNAADFGVPQQRFRVFIVGNRRDLPKSQRFSFPEPTHAKDPNGSGRLPWLTISQAVKDIPEPDDNHSLLNHICSKYKVTNRNFTGHRTTDPDKPSPTILARGNGKGGVCAIQHPRNHRRLSVRESALVQTFPIDFNFHGSLNSMYRQVGNAVPVLLAQKIAEQFAVIERRKNRKA